MNYEQIKKEYPKAYRLLIKWVRKNQVSLPRTRIIPLTDSLVFISDYIGVGGDLEVVFNDRDLFDLFDEYNIIVETYKEMTVGGGVWKYSVRWFNDGKLNSIPVGISYGSRECAEQIAFVKAFKILNNENNRGKRRRGNRMSHISGI